MADTLLNGPFAASQCREDSPVVVRETSMSLLLPTDRH
jgi:hypothetical protein